MAHIVAFLRGGFGLGFTIESSKGSTTTPWYKICEKFLNRAFAITAREEIHQDKRWLGANVG